MQENTTKIIGVCVADISTDYNDRFFEAFKRLAHEFHFKVLFFSAFSPLYWDQKHDIGEGNIYQLIDTDVLDGLIMLTITIKNEFVRESIIEHAKKRDIPVISIEYPLEGSLSIIYEYKSTIRKLLSHLIDDHGYRRINFIAGLKDNLFSEERLQVYRKHGSAMAIFGMVQHTLSSNPLSTVIFQCRKQSSVPTTVWRSLPYNI